MSLDSRPRRGGRAVVGAGVPARRSVVLLVVRVALVAGVTVAAWVVLRSWNASMSFPPTPVFSAFGMLPVNLVSLFLVSRLLRAEGRRVRDLFAPGPGGWFRDVAWGLLWLVVLYLPFLGAITGVMWVLHGDNVFVAFETVFYDDADTVVPVSLWWALVLGVVSAVTFAPLNAPVEEAVYRGYAQPRLARAWSTPVAILVCSLIFGLQHMFFAPTSEAMVVFFVGFTVWGLGSAVIVHKQGRLLPVTVAHFFVNLVPVLPGVVFPVLQLSGAVSV